MEHVVAWSGICLIIINVNFGNSCQPCELTQDGAGLPFHVHGASWLAVVFGAKHWFLVRTTPDRMSVITLCYHSMQPRGAAC